MWHRLGRDDFDRTNELKRIPDQGSKVWRVCQEYELQELTNAGDGTLPYRLRPRYPYAHGQEDKWSTYKPLEDTPDLFLRFTNLYGQDGSIEPIVDWVHRYGVLEDWGKTQDLTKFRWAASRAAGILTLYEAVLNGDDEEAKTLILEEFWWLSVLWYRLYRVLPEEFPRMPEVQIPYKIPREMVVALILELVENDYNGDYLEYALWGVVVEVEMWTRRSCYPTLEIEEGQHHDPSKVRTSWNFGNLLAAMFLQMHWLVAAGGSVTRCKYCGRIVSLASPLPGARKARQDKQFCDNACRQRYHYHHRVKSKKPNHS